MKLRIRNNTLRLRLTRDEVAGLEDTGKVTAFTEFGAAPQERLVYTVESSGDSPNVSAQYTHGSISVTLPSALVKLWAQGDLVGLEGEQPLNNYATLKIIVEKDFTCLTKQNEKRMRTTSRILKKVRFANDIRLKDGPPGGELT